MNRHLNVFKFFSKEDRNYQLENDLTRAFAICLQEDNLFFHEVLKHLFNESNYYNQFFEDIDRNSEITVEIQKKVNAIGEFNHLFAVSLSESLMDCEDFWSQHPGTENDPIVDVVIRINDVVIIIEAKRNGVNCTAQLFNQAHNLHRQNKLAELDFKKSVTPIDLNWPSLMELAIKILSFEKATQNINRFLYDFIHLIKIHNYRWLPEPPISSLSSDNKKAIKRRIESAVQELGKIDDHPLLSNRLGIQFQKPWAQEILFSITDEGSLVASIYPGNTKSQGHFIFQNDPKFNTHIEIDGIEYPLEQIHHIKFTSFQRYFAGLFFTEEVLSSPLYTKKNFNQYTGRKKRGQDWKQIEVLFDNVFTQDYNWKKHCQWNDKIMNSGKNQFDISFGYEISLNIPFEKLKAIDNDKSDLTGLVNLLNRIVKAFNENLLK
ncbi:hypothetical protein [Litoribacter populi]|uniref:hypothetical protein n=1 Tax=Litoribacter populi TaxID=2598460 RepID=UPI00117EF532|nr:hypothetical protein [Litoribacter populi]